MNFSVKETSIKDNSFPSKKTSIPGLGQQLAFIIRCQSCGETDSLHVNRKSIPSTGFVAGRFRGRGWSVSNFRRDHDTCPKCSATNSKVDQMPAAPPKISLVEPTKSSPLVVSAAPRPDVPEAMSREDKRIIFGRLNDIYLDEKSGYSNGWSDARVAGDLGVPRAWVVAVRDENFGPDGSNEEARQIVADARQLVVDVQKAAEVSRAANATLMAALAQVDALTKRIDRIAKQLGIS